MISTIVAVLSAWTVLLLSYNVVLFLRQGLAHAKQHRWGVQTGLIALLTVAALKPATEHLVQSSTQAVSKAVAKLPLSTAFGVFEGFPSDPSGWAGFVTMPAVDALYNGIFGTPKPFDVECPSGNCSWDKPYTTLAVCSSCTNLTSELKPLVDSDGQDVGLLLPNGFHLRYNANQGWPMGERQMYVAMNVTAVGIPWMRPRVDYESIAYLNMPGKLFDTFVVVGSDPSVTYYMSESPAPAAYECALQWCLRQSTAKVVDGKLTEQLVNIINDTTVDVHDPEWKLSRQLTDPKTSMVYNVSSSAERVYAGMIAAKFNGTHTANQTGDAEPLTALWAAVARPEDSPAKFFDDLATSVNTFMRTKNSAIKLANYSTAEGVVSYNQVSTPSVSLALLTYPLLLLAAIALVVLASSQPHSFIQLGLDDASSSPLDDEKTDSL